MSGRNQLQYFCDFVPVLDIPYNLSIKWYLSSKSSPRREIISFDSRKFVRNFRIETSLTEACLNASGTTTLPFTVCYYIFYFTYNV